MKIADNHDTHLSVTAAATALGVERKIVLAWIASRELPATDIRRTGGIRPTYRIDGTDLEDFKARRSTLANRASAPRRRRAPRKSTPAARTWI